MSNALLIPHWYKRIGWWILVPSTIAGLLISFTGYEASWLDGAVFTIYDASPFGKSKWFQFSEANLTATVVGVLFIIGALLVGFSREKEEDEYVAQLRLSSLLWAVWVNYFLLLLAFLFVYGISFLTVMVYNMFTVLIIFLIRFNYLLYKNAKKLEE